MDREHKFHTLDALRGVAAILVVGRHAGVLGYTTPESFLAVDLFFCLSGFVIARAYDERLARGRFFGRFVAIRLIRLFPLYLLGLALGIAGAMLGNAPVVTTSVLAGLLMLPQNPWLPGDLGTYNPPIWTLPFELLANLLYALCFRWMTLRILAAIAGLSAACLVWCAYGYGNLDLGWAPGQWPVGLSRLFFSFPAGVILARVAGDRRRCRPVAAWACVIAAEAMLILQPSASLKLGYELAVILFGFPALVLAACRSEPSPGSVRLFAFSGAISYAIYTLHAPLAHLAVAAGVRDPGRPEMLLFLAALALAAWLADRWFDRPVRRWLTGLLFPCRASPRPPAAEAVLPATG